MKKLLVFLLLSGHIHVIAQPTFPVNGPHDERDIPRLFVNATIHPDAQTVIKNGTLVVHRDHIEYCGADFRPTAGAEVTDLSGMHIYPAFIDLYSDYGIPEVKKHAEGDRPQYDRKENKAFAWNDALHPDYQSVREFSPDEKASERLLESGFGAVLSHRHDGVARGTGVLVAPGEGPANEKVILSEAGAFYSFKKGSSTQRYPSSLMGAMALLRQTHYDARWYAESGVKEERNFSLESWNRIQPLTQIFELTEKNDLPRVKTLADEFGLHFIVKSAGDDYHWLQEAVRCGFPFILPLNFPGGYDVSDPYDSRLISLQELLHWEAAPANAGLLAESGAVFCFTAFGTEKSSDFLTNLRKTVQYGLDTAAALNALTAIPAHLLGVSDKLGTIQAGKLANFIITTGDLFAADTEIAETWALGERYRHKDIHKLDVRGVYNLNLDNHFYTLEVKGSSDKPVATVLKITEKDTVTIKADFSAAHQLVTLAFNPKDEHYSEVVRLSGNIHKESRIWEGQAHLADGSWLPWTAIRQRAKSKAKESAGEETIPDFRLLSRTPYRAWGVDSLPAEETLWIKEATIWTCSEDGVIENGEMLIHSGKILAVGKRLNPDELMPRKNGDIKVLRLRGKHITPGLIDEHSHIAISRGVNEGTKTSSAEVRISDAINPDDINIFRHLSGGVTTVQQLHGSANPIGGQSSIIKMRWGLPASGLRFEDAPGFIKFALGENVKQSNWGERETVRYPQTRMGVEQVYYDYFLRARQYSRDWSALESESKKREFRLFKPKKEPQQYPLRTDLGLATLSEILEGNRHISCHSYVQSEINMLMHVGDSLGFRVNTFTHVLEGYKVADKMKQHGAGGSTFSDWWTYKMEVNDAIPYNAAILHQQGVVVAMNSDDAELARRLNHEAAKAVKYGGVSEEEALKMVTLNPAKLLHLDDRVGSLEPGKHADIVIWSDHPLSVYAKAERTYIDGRCYFDRSKLEEIQQRDAADRARILSRMKDNGGAKSKKSPAKNPNDKEYHCDDVDEEI